MSDFAARNINRIYLMLGGRCNFSCRYCLQSLCKEPEAISEPTAEVYAYIETLIKRRPKNRGKLNLTFWGGEPLLYLPTIKAVIARLGDAVEYGLVTNGSLLTDDFVDFANQNNIAVVLSNDGEGTKTSRKINALENPEIVGLFKRIERKAVESVISAYNYDFQKLFAYIEDKLGAIPVHVDMLKITWAMPDDLYKINLAEYQRSLRTASEKAKDDILKGGITNEVRMFLPALKFIANGGDADRLQCGNFYNALNVDLKGNIFFCHNSAEQLGRISDERVTLAERFEKWKTEKLKDCAGCVVQGLCRGGCPLETEFKKITCNLNRLFFLEALNLATDLNDYFEPVDLEL